MFGRDRRLIGEALAVVVVGASLSACSSGVPKARASAAPRSEESAAAPIRAAFYYPWFPETWGAANAAPSTNYHPQLGRYSSSDLSVVRRHIAEMEYGQSACVGQMFFEN